MTIPKAVSPSTLTPGVFMTVDLLAGSASPSTGVLRVLLVAPKASTGTLVPDTEFRAGGGTATAKIAYGARSPGYLGSKLLYSEYPSATVDFATPTAGSGSATISITAAGVPSADTAVDLTIKGIKYQIPWLNGQTVDTWKASAITFVNSKSDECPTIASSGGTGVLTLTFSCAGKIGNDCLVQAALSAAQTGTETISGAATPTALSGGTTDFDVTTLMSNAAGKEYHLIVLCTSNADAQAASSSNPLRIKTAIGAINSGLNAKLEQLIVSSTGTISAAKVGAIALNTPIAQHVNALNAQSMPFEITCQQAGQRLAAISIDPSANRIGDPLNGIVGSYQVIIDNPVLASSEDAIGNGVSVVGYTSNGTPIMKRPITTYSQDSSGSADRRCLDVQNVDATYIISRDVRDNLPLAFPKAKIVRDAPSDAEAPDIEGVTEERDIRGWIIDRLRFWQDQGQINKDSLDEAIADGTLIVEVDDSDETQVNIVIPFKIVKPLAKFSIVVQRFN